MEIYVPDDANLVNPLRFLNRFQAVPRAQCGILCRFVLVLQRGLVNPPCVFRVLPFPASQGLPLALAFLAAGRKVLFLR